MAAINSLVDDLARHDGNTVEPYKVEASQIRKIRRGDSYLFRVLFIMHFGADLGSARNGRQVPGHLVGASVARFAFACCHEWTKPELQTSTPRCVIRLSAGPMIAA